MTNKSIQRLLVANRGEIAIRIMKTAKTMGMTTIAVFSEADRYAAHVRYADEAVCIGNSPAAESYLNSDHIMQAARLSRADAIHPGYGFLSERASFAQAVQEAGLIFVGPPADAIDALGNKAMAKQLMTKAGVPTLPGYHGDDQNSDKLCTAIEEIGRPALIKAVAGGGGRGMRLVRDGDDAKEAILAARQEASTSFGDAHVLIEKFLPNPRHIEVQVFADAHGGVRHLFTRDCSLQRRHQKVIEEAPAPFIPDTILEQIGDAACKAITGIGYQGAGTVEFLLDEDGCFYFLEINTRLQVEHPVTEMITNLDLVAWQLQIAQGEKLPSHTLKPQGHAIEVRLCAEVPHEAFRPSTGKISALEFPQMDGLRIDSGVFTGDKISPFYDSLIAKLIVHADNRSQAITLMKEALAQTFVAGIDTNRDFLLQLLSTEVFQQGQMSTRFIDEHLEHVTSRSDQSLQAQVLAALFLLKTSQENPDPIDNHNPYLRSWDWALNMNPRHDINFVGRHPFTLSLIPQKDGYMIIDPEGTEIFAEITGFMDKRLSICLDGQPTHGYVLRHQNTVFVQTVDRSWSFEIFDALAQQQDDLAMDNIIRAEIPGQITQIHVGKGDIVASQSPLITMEAMKIITTFRAPQTVIVDDIRVNEGDQVHEGQTLMTLETAS